MTLQELAQEYRQSGQAIRDRVRALTPRLRDPAMSETQRLELRRRVSILRSMARDTLAVARYLETYYGKEDTK